MRIAKKIMIACLCAPLTGAGAQALVGAAAEDNSFAATTLMVLQRGARGSGFCTGVVVARNVVLTAAHCVGSAQDTRVHFREGGGRQTTQQDLLGVTAVSVHPLYRANAAKTRERSIDLALVRLAAPLPARFHAVEMERAPNIAVGAQFRIAGFGVAREGRGETGGILRSGVLAARAPLSSILLWAEDPQHNGFGACTGDSGGPIFSNSGTLVAVTSWAEGAGGKACGKLTQAALIGPQMPWIEGVLRSWTTR